jgi:hypothetical protein
MAYSFEENDTDGRLYTYRMNALSGGLDFEFGERIRISSGLGFAYFHFPLMGGARADSMVRAGANGSYALDSNWFLTLDWSTILVQSKDVEFTYGRYRFAGGIRYLF